MASRAIDERVMMAGSILSALEMHQVEVAGPLRERLFAEQAATYAVGDVLESLAGALERARDAMLDSDEAVEAEANDDQQYRDARDEATAELKRTLRDVRGLVDAAYGPELLEPYGLGEDLPRSPQMLCDLAEGCVDRMRTRPLEERSPYGFELDMGLLADRVETAVVPLTIALEDLRREVREIKEAIGARHEAIEAFDETFRAVAEAIHSFFVLAGRPDLASMVEP